MKVLVLGLKWAIVLKYSTVCLFFWSGYSGFDTSTISNFVAFSSKSCFAFSVFVNIPVTIIEELIDNLHISLKLSKVFSNTIFTALSILIIYGIHFILTYISSKNIINKG